ncbi:tRNA (adenine(37)-N6)-methyltransferase [Alosa pseudoharengus]|uniref:tRNA (adenine(37)-N6)-methyltransferase n=1 Tax=Alosa pseudoharengus TaxID=34774 RepID=UPI003F8C8A0C
MSQPACSCCVENVKRLQEQISVMRRELKNLRQRADGSIRSHRKHMSALQSVLSTISQDTPQTKVLTPNAGEKLESSLEKGCLETVPIGYIHSCFAGKNGTPRQPTVCGPSRATLKIQQAVFSNPDHPLIGLEQYSHVWIIFLFHKNGHLSYKAKVKPPRLNGQRVGVYSTRSPHRPNALGLTLAKLERVAGDTLHLSGVDMIMGTPVLDIKPYIPDYDCPHMRLHPEECDLPSGEEAEDESECPRMDGTSPFGPSAGTLDTKESSSTFCPASSNSDDLTPLGAVLSEVKDYLHQGEFSSSRPAEVRAAEAEPSDTALSGPHKELETRLHFGEESYSTIASWIRQPPVSMLEVRFTQHAERELKEFMASDSTVMGKPRFRFLKDSDEAVAAIRAVLSADPRSVYRRTRCQDRLFYFTMDTADITCWFGDGFAEVLRVQPLKR